MTWFLIILFGILSLILLSGHGSFLIAGYNTSSKEQKKKYNEKRLCRVIGSGMGVVTILLALLAFFGENPPKWFLQLLPVLMLIDIAIMLLVSNFGCKAKPEETASSLKAASSEKNSSPSKKRILRGSLLLTLVVFIIVGILLTTGHVKMSVEKDILTVDGSYWSDYQIPISEIQSIDYRKSFHRGRRVNGLGSFKLLEGHFENEEYSDYTLYAYLKCEHHIVLKTNQGILVLNAETAEKTKELYQLLKSCLS